jgi:hypothetical protein
MVGDTSEALALNLSKLEGQAGRFDEALAVCRRLIDERGREVSPYNLAEIWNQMAWLYWRKGERERGWRSSGRGSNGTGPRCAATSCGTLWRPSSATLTTTC